MGTPALFLDGKLVETSNLVLFEAGGLRQTIYMYPIYKERGMHDKHLVVKFGEMTIGATRHRHQEGPYDRWPAPKAEDAKGMLPLRWESSADRLLLELTEFADEEDGDVEDEVHFYEHVTRDLVFLTGTSHYAVPDREWLGISIDAHFKQPPAAA
jgi:hypothetical protein